MCGHSSETDAGPTSKTIQDEKDIRGSTPEVEEGMLEHATSQESPNMA
jgi:hypothetical protein